MFQKIQQKEVLEVLGSKEEGVSGVRLKDRVTGEESVFPTQGFFLAIGHVPNTAVFEGQLDIDETGYIKIPDTTTTCTNIDGVFAAGDVRDTSTKQVVSAAGEGSTAALEIREYLRRV